jgi:Clostridium P-47 protein
MSNSIATVNTYHWDTVYVANFDVVNQAIAKNNSFPSNFDYASDEGINIQGKWKSWALSTGGSGSNIQMTCTVESGTVTYATQSGDLSGSTLVIQFVLDTVLGEGGFTDPTAKSGTGQPAALQTKLTAGSGSKVPPITVIDAACTFPNLNPNTFGLILDALPGVFGKYFNANASDFKHTFHVMMIGEEADKDGFTWIKPSAIGYAVDAPVTGATTQNSAFGVLSMVDGGIITSLQESSVDIAALIDLPDGSNSAFVISAPKVIEHMLLSGAISTIQGSTASDFSISDGGLNITNINSILWGNFQTDHGIISPMLDPGTFLMRLEGDSVLIEITGATYSPSLGITVSLNLKQRFGFSTVRRQDGKFVFIPDITSFGKPTISSSVSVAKGMEIAEIVIGVVGLVAALAGGVSALANFLTAGATTAVTSATEGTIVISEEVAEEATEGLSEAELSSINEDSAASADEGAEDPSDTTQVQKGGFLKSTQFRTYAGITAAIAGITSGGMALASPLTQLQYDELPTFDDFAANILGASKWPETNNYEIMGAILRESLVCGIKVT